MPALTKILIIAANPWDTKRLGLDEEYREIKNIWQQSKRREHFILEYAPAAREAELRQALLDFEPNIIHFSGHGELDGLFFLDNQGNSQQIETQALANLFALFANQIDCVVLNACYSEGQAQSIVENIHHVIGMNTAIGDLAAVKFATGFYQALFNGREIDFAYKFACNTIDLSNIDEKDTPVLITKQPIKPTLVNNYLKNYTHDILIHVAESEEIWATTLVQQLQKHLNQRFPEGLKVQLQANNNIVFKEAATNLLLLSASYVANYADDLHDLSQLIKEKRLFLADYQPAARPQILNGLLSYNFWQVDPTQGLRSLSPSDYDYGLQVENLVEEIEKRLKALFQQQQLKTSPAIASDTATTLMNDALVFVNVASEDRPLGQKIQQSLSKNGIASTLPIDHALNPPSLDIRRDIEMNVLNCDAVLVIYDSSSPFWVKEQLLLCHRWQRKREEPLKIIALHNSNAKLPDVHLPNLQVFYCPPDELDDYLTGFMAVLK